MRRDEADAAAGPVHVESQVVTLPGVVDADATGALLELVARLAPDEEVVVDCRGARLWHPAALAELASAMREARCAVRLLGLGYHQQRLLRYLGPESAPSLDG